MNTLGQEDEENIACCTLVGSTSFVFASLWLSVMMLGSMWAAVAITLRSRSALSFLVIPNGMPGFGSSVIGKHNMFQSSMSPGVRGPVV